MALPPDQQKLAESILGGVQMLLWEREHELEVRDGDIRTREGRLDERERYLNQRSDRLDAHQEELDLKERRLRTQQEKLEEDRQELEAEKRELRNQLVPTDVRRGICETCRRNSCDRLERCYNEAGESKHHHRCGPCHQEWKQSRSRR